MNNKYVTFEQAKLLKEKGLRSYGCKIYHTENELREYPNIPKFYPEAKSREDVYESTDIYFAPKQHQVVDWLLEKHGIWILVLPQDKSGIDFRLDNSEYPSHALFFSIIKYEKDCSYKEIINTSSTDGKLFLHFDTLQKAYSAAIDYILLNNLI